MAKRLFITPRPSTFEIGKPNFPKINLFAQAPFHEFIGPRSWLFFFLIKLNNPQEWLQLPPQLWPLFSDYRYARDLAKKLEVTNDCAERGVKLTGDFKDYTDDEEQRQFLLQVVEDLRKNNPSLLKKNLNSANK